MKLTPKKVKYSGRYGLSIEWQRPDEMTINGGNMIVMLWCLKGFLDQKDMDAAFKPEEQAVIQKFFLLLDQKVNTMIASYTQKQTLKKLKADLRHALDWWKLSYEFNIQNIMTQIWGWKLTAEETLPVLDRLLLGAIKVNGGFDYHRMHLTIVAFIGDPEMTEPLPETIAKVEAAYGPLDWEKLKEEGRQYYEERLKRGPNRQNKL